MAGRSIRVRLQEGPADVLLATAYSELNSLGIEMLSFPTRSTITKEDKTSEISKCCELISDILAEWPKLPDLAGVREWPPGVGFVTDFVPRKGKKLQRWKRAQNAAELLRLAQLSISTLEEAVDAELEAINGDEDASLEEIAKRGAWYEELSAKLWDLIPALDSVADRIEAVEFPRLA